MRLEIALDANCDWTTRGPTPQFSAQLKLLKTQSELRENRIFSVGFNIGCGIKPVRVLWGRRWIYGKAEK